MTTDLLRAAVANYPGGGIRGGAQRTACNNGQPAERHCAGVGFHGLLEGEGLKVMAWILLSHQFILGALVPLAAENPTLAKNEVNFQQKQRDGTWLS